MDPGAGSLDNFIERSKHNFENRALHQHIYKISLIQQMYLIYNLSIFNFDFSYLTANQRYECMNIEVLAFDWFGPYNMATLGVKIASS